MAKKKKSKAKGKVKKKAKARPKAAVRVKRRKSSVKPEDKRSEYLTIKVSPKELQGIFHTSDRFARGNTSQLVRHAITLVKKAVPQD